MRRSISLAAFTIVLGFSATSNAQHPDSTLRVERIRDNLYVLKGGGGNSTVFITTTGVVVVDAKEAGSGRVLLDTIRTLTDKPVTTLINTDPHLDHVGGNADFPADVQIIAQRNIRKRMQKMGARGHALPTRTFRNKLTLGRGEDEVDLFYFGRGHTDGDTWVFFPATGVVHVGDLFPGEDLPLLDGKNGGSALEIAQTLETGFRKIKGATLVVTGHGVERTWPELQEYLSFTNRFVNEVWLATRQRKSVDDIVRDWTIPADYEKYAPIDAARLKNNVALAVKELNDEARMYEFQQRNYPGDSYIGPRSTTDASPPPTPSTPTSAPESSPPPPDAPN
jgi:glyoxylase-like metal-dependent hydrolase (beta-lactamase superfamily II)